MQTVSSDLSRLAQIYLRMDAAYHKTAQACGFVCNGCEENCCRSLFYHHTLIEHLMLQAGLDRLPSEARKEVIRRALEVHRQPATGARLCPLNAAGRCILYEYRPMICRLHGVPHRLHLPDGKVHVGPGCALCESSRNPDLAIRLDRTPFYKAMAELEQDTRRTTGWTGKRRRMTIAEMILVDPAGLVEDLNQMRITP